jgi:hypothetical protein
MPNTNDTQAFSPTFTHKATSAAVVTSATKYPQPSNNGRFSDGDPFIFHNPLHISNPDISPMLRHKAPLSDFDPTLYEDYEIPWGSHTPSQATEPPGADITFEDFFDFVEQSPGMHVHQSLFFWY